MGKIGSKYKIKLLKIYEILKQNTDEDHPMGSKELIARLESEGISCDRKILYDDIKILNDNGFTIETTRHQQLEFYIDDNNFSLPELKILTDAIQAANFITEKKSVQLTEKVSALAGSHKAEVLKRVLKTKNPNKVENESIYYNVDTITRAINEGYKISFRYFDYDANGEEVFRKQGEVYIENPIELAIFEDKYYLIAYNEKHEDKVPYRLDKMKNVDVVEKSAVKVDIKDLERIREQVFSMFMGNLVEVTIVFDKSLINQMFDRFGKTIRFIEYDQNNYVMHQRVCISPTFYSWCFIFGDKLKITAPANVKDEYKKRLEDAIKNME